MSLRTKVVSLLLVLFLGYAGLHYAVQELVIYPGFVELEHEETVKNVERALLALQRELDALVPSARDWASWDETYQFLADRGFEYRDANLGEHTLLGLGLDAMAIFDLDGRIVWGLIRQPAAEGDNASARMVALEQSAERVLLQPFASGQPRAGIVLSQDEPLMVVALPVLTSGGEGPARGSLLMARALDADAIGRLASQVRVDLRISLAPSGAEGGAPNPKPTRLHSSAPRVLGEHSSAIGEATVMDIHGRPALLIAVKPPPIAARGREALWFATTSTALAGALVLLFLLVTMRRTLLDPVSELTAQALLVGSRQDFSVRLGSKRRDELGLLSREFDRMVEQLAQAREQLAAQSYKSGVAEMASGVLHNIGNALTPVGVKLSNLRQALAGAPLEEVGLAAVELAEGHLDAERRADMDAFLALAGTELAELVRRAARDLDGVQANVDHIQRILADQHRFSRAERVIESVALAPMINEAVALLPEWLRSACHVEIAAELTKVAPIRAPRVALQQVVGNLLINAAEAVAAIPNRASSGVVRVSCEEEVIEGVPMVHLRFTDNGVGIAQEDLSRIFARAYSTKSRGSGMGLHWSANTIQILGGRLFAESDGPGRGTCLHLLLPQAAATQSLPEAA
jgi:sensor domain CHASE-containing protein